MMYGSDADILLGSTGLGTPQSQFVPGMDDLVKQSDDQLSQTDIGLINLWCAFGLPGGEYIDIADCTRVLDEWAKVVARETDLGRSNFRPNPSCPTDAHFRCFMLIKILKDRLPRSAHEKWHGLLHTNSGGKQ